MNPKVKPSLLAVDDSQIVYVCGHNTVIYNTETPSYRFIQGKSEDECGAKVTLHHLLFLQFWWGTDPIDFGCFNRSWRNSGNHGHGHQPQQEVLGHMWARSTSCLLCLRNSVFEAEAHPHYEWVGCQGVYRCKICILRWETDQLPLHSRKYLHPLTQISIIVSDIRNYLASVTDLVVTNKLIHF